MNPTTNTTAPATGPDRFFVKSIDDYTTHATLDDAIRESNDRIQDCLCDGWDEEAVRAIEYGAIMGGAKMFNKRPDPTEDFAYLCEYEAAPIPASENFAAKGMGDLEAAIFCHGMVGFLDVALISAGLEIKDLQVKKDLYSFISALMVTNATKKDAK